MGARGRYLTILFLLVAEACLRKLQTKYIHIGEQTFDQIHTCSEDEGNGNLGKARSSKADGTTEFLIMTERI